MPQVIFLGMIGAGLYAGYRWFVRASEQIASEMRRTTEEEVLRPAPVRNVKDLGALEYDPVSGVYRPVDRR